MPRFILYDESTREILFIREREDAATFFESIKYDIRLMVLTNPEKFSLASYLRVAQIDPGFSLQPAELTAEMKDIIKTKRTLLEGKC